MKGRSWECEGVVIGCEGWGEMGMGLVLGRSRVEKLSYQTVKPKPSKLSHCHTRTIVLRVCMW